MKFAYRLHQRLVNGHARNSLEWLLFFVLIPCSLLYGCVVWLRNFLYDVDLLSSCRSNVPVVSVGNLTAGGTGKTPVVDFLLKEFQARGKQPVVISRGYGGTFSGDVGVVSNGKELLMAPEEAGDEPYLLAKKNPSCLVLIARKRVSGIKYVEDQFVADVIVLDDAFQHRAAARDLDILLLDATRPLGNGWPLPAGSLREFKSALKRADLFIMTRSEFGKYHRFQGQPVYNSRHQLTDTAVNLQGDAVSLRSLKGRSLLAFAGIAKPDSFFSALEDAGLTLSKKHSLPDHVNYQQGDVLAQLNLMAKNVDALITTEKDAVKLSGVVFAVPCYQLAMTIDLENRNDFMDSIFEKLWRE